MSPGIEVGAGLQLSLGDSDHGNSPKLLRKPYHLPLPPSPMKVSLRSLGVGGSHSGLRSRLRHWLNLAASLLQVPS